MSFSVTTWAIQQRPKTTTHKLILVILAECLNDKTGLCFPSVAYIAERALCSSRNVTRILNDLESDGYIEIMRKPGKSNHYSLLTNRPTPDTGVTPDNLSPLQPMSPHPCNPCHPTPDTGVTLTYKEPRIEPRSFFSGKPKNKKNTPLPDGFTLTDDRFNQAMRHFTETGCNESIPDCFDHFIDHHLAHGSLLFDWDAAWGSWFRKAAKIAQNATQGESVGFVAKHSDNSWADSL